MNKKKVLYTFYSNEQKTIMDLGTCGSHVCGKPGDATTREIINDLSKSDILPPRALIGFDVVKKENARYKITVESK